MCCNVDVLHCVNNTGRRGEHAIATVFNHQVRRCMGMWISNVLHHLWCEAGQCYSVSEACVCKLCGSAGVKKYHLLRCEWANCGQLLVNRDNIRQIIKGLHTFNT